AALMLAQPFFATPLLKLRHVEDDTLNPPSMTVTPREIRYHPEFIARCTIDEAMFVLCHEVLHMAWDHLPRVRHYLTAGHGPDGKPLDPRLFNQAMDFPINAALVEGNVGSPPAWWPLCLDPRRFPSSMTPEEVYCLLRKEQQGGGGGGGGGEPLDTHDPTDTSEGAAPAITPADVLQAAQVHKALRGKAPAGMERLLDAMRRPDVSPWRRLRQFITKSLPGHDATSWRRLQRRMIVRRIGVPGRVTQ
ncbi:hypothetical protein LNT18_29100, partial [Klebsiella pneumoniae]|nr:hypothetical protein [Klebsiella pneumoniae]